MRFPSLTLPVRLRAAILGTGACLLVGAATMAGPVLADQSSTTPAQDKIGSHTHQLHGTVDATSASGATTFVLDTERYGKVTVSFTGSTPHGRGHGHGHPRSSEAGKVSELKAGERVVVQGRANGDASQFIARRVHVLPEAGTAHAAHLVGSLAAVSTSGGTTTLTIKLADGTSQTVTATSETKIRPTGKTLSDLTVGTKVTVVAKNGGATGIMVMPA